MKRAIIFLVAIVLPLLVAGGDAQARFGFARTYQSISTGNFVGTQMAIHPASGDIILCGYYSGQSYFDGTLLDSAGGATQAFLMRFDVEGGLKWVRKITGSGVQRAHGVAVDGEGNIYVTGESDGAAVVGGGSSGSASLTGTSKFMFLTRYTPQGNLEWARATNASTGYSQAAGTALMVDSSGNIYVGGWFADTILFGDILISGGLAPTNVFVAKYDSTGSIKQVEKMTSASWCRINRIVMGESGAIMAVGEFSGSAFGLSSTGNSDAFLVRYNSDLALQWARKAGGSGVDAAQGVAVDASGDIFVVGRVSGTAGFGDKQVVSAGGSDGFVARYDASGNILWAKGFGGSGEDVARGVSISDSGQLAVTGEFSETVTAGSRSIRSRGGQDAFVARYSLAGDFISAYTGGGEGDDQGKMAAWQEETLVVAGGFEGSAVFGETSVGTHATLEGGELFVSFMDDSLEALAGDFNGDDWVNLADVIAILQMLTSREDVSYPGAMAADMNEDGRVGLADVIAILQIIADKQ